MKHHSILIKLYYLLVYADGVVDQKELAMGRRMCLYEKIDESTFDQEINNLKGMDHDLIYKESLRGLKLLTPGFQIRFIAWLSLIANADGFMDEREWQLIYRLYNKDLCLSLADIMTKQKELKLSLKESQQGGFAART